MPELLALGAMGTRFELVLCEPPSCARFALRAAGELALEEIQLVERRWSLFRRDSLIAHLNREAGSRACRLEADDFELLDLALAVWRDSAGAFDPTSSAARGGASLAEAVELDRRAGSVRFLDRRVRLDLGGIAKGQALDLAGRSLREHGLQAALLHGGTSSILALGAPPGRTGWSVALESGPDPAQVVLADRALGLSSQDGQLRQLGRAHVVDPRTGRPATRGVVAVAAAPSAALADAWSTAALVWAGRAPGTPWPTPAASIDLLLGWRNAAAHSWAWHSAPSRDFRLAV
jgi:thiamine biosynthesis lipoprotein